MADQTVFHRKLFHRQTACKETELPVPYTSRIIILSIILLRPVHIVKDKQEAELGVREERIRESNEAELG